MSEHRKGGITAGPLLMRAVELLEDQRWHFTEDVVREIMKVVPPGKALRAAEKSRVSGNSSKPRQRDWKPPPERVRPISTERAIQVGARVLARQVLFHPSFERSGSGETQLIRMVKLPKSVAERRRLVAEGKLFQADEVADQLLATTHRRPILDRMEKHHMEKLVIELLHRLDQVDVR